jgi:hypothetical protein
MSSSSDLDRVCPVCSKQFRASFREQETCTRDCAVALRRQRDQAGLDPDLITPIGPQKRCAVCGEGFHIWRFNGQGDRSLCWPGSALYESRRTCGKDACRFAIRSKAAKGRKRGGAKKKSPPRPKQPKHPDPTPEEIARMCREIRAQNEPEAGDE